MPEALSAYLDLLRFLAACVVVISHLNYPAFGGHWMPGDWVAYGPDAVIVFFVLSGYVIAYVADRKERTVGAYLVSRLSRIWSVAIPALALAAIADNIGWRISPIPYNAFPSFSWHEWPMALLANATFVNELWFAAIYPLSDGPFWSLGFEFWYYLIFAAVFYFTGRRRILLTALAAAIAGPKILLLLPIWWAGVELYRIPRLRSPAAGWFAFALPLPLYVAARMADLPEHILWHTDALGIHYARFDSAEMFIWYYVVGALVVLHFLGAKTVMAGQLTGIMQRLARPTTAAAGYTLSIYLFHFPLLVLGAAALAPHPSDPGRNLLIVAFATAVIIPLGSYFEPRRYILRRWLRMLIIMERTL